MKRKFFVLCSLVLFLSSCGKKSIKQNVLSTNNLKSFFISLHSDSAYNLKTTKGAILKIAPNSFDVPAGTIVQVEIKEAYSASDILLAGLTTESNGKLLRSAGMLYFNATANNKTVDIVKPIEATIPSTTYDKDMQVFKGELMEDSTINWVEPQKLDTSPVAKNLLDGYALFKTNCASCHKPTQEFTGPMLAGSRQRAPNPEWPYQFINNVNSMVEYDEYAKNLIREYGSKMTQFNLKKEDIKAILDYADNEALLNPLPEKDPANNTTVDSIALPVKYCGSDTFYYAPPDTSIRIIGDNYTEPLAFTASNEDLTEYINEVSIPESKQMYQFDIDKSGWYNIDVFIDKGNVTKVQLLSKLNADENIDITVYLCIPKRKVLIDGSKNEDNNYIFDNDANGDISLIANDDAYVFAIGRNKDKVYYGISPFTIQSKQMVPVQLKESTQEEILKAFEKNNIDGLPIDVEKKEMEIIERPCDEKAIPVAFIPAVDLGSGSSADFDQ